MGELPWNEKLVSFQVNPESATIADIVRMAEELVALRGTEKEPYGFTEATYATGTNDSPEPIILSRAEPVSAVPPA